MCVYIHTCIYIIHILAKSNIEKHSIYKRYDVDDVLLIKSQIKDIKKTLNPYQFNYKAFLEKQYIYHQIHTQNSLILELATRKTTIAGLADLLRQKINKQLNKSNFNA